MVDISHKWRNEFDSESQFSHRLQQAIEIRAENERRNMHCADIQDAMECSPGDIRMQIADAFIARDHAELGKLITLVGDAYVWHLAELITKSEE